MTEQNNEVNTLALAQAKFQEQQSNKDVVAPADKPNPANDTETFDEANWVPMSAPIARLQVPEKAGWHRHWFRNDPGRIERARQAGYQFVDPQEVNVVGKSIGGSPEQGGNSDLGSRVSIAAGGFADNGQAQRLYLMECPIRLYNRNLAMLQADTDSTVRALNAGRGGSSDPSNGDKSYIRGDLPKLFQKKIPSE